MNHNDATDKDLPVDPDATEIVALDLEQLLHRELDAQRQAQTVSHVKAAQRRSSMRLSTSHVPASSSAIPPLPIHSFPPPAPDEDDDATCVFDRASAKMSTQLRTPSVKSVTFPAPNFSPPRKPQPFATIPSMPVAKRNADQSQGITPIQPILPPTSRRDIYVGAPKAYESIAPVAMPSSYPSYPPAPSGRASALAAVFTLTFALASMLVIGVAVFRPAFVQRGKVAVATAMKPRHVDVPIATAPKTPAPITFAVPPVLIEDEPDVTIGDEQTYLIFPESAKGHRVFFDGRAIGDGDTPALVDCGKHKLQIGSTAKEKAIDLACGAGYRLE